MLTNPVLQSFRDEVREFCARELPSELRSRVEHNQLLDKSDYVSWQKTLRRRGWFAGHWPVAHGGQGWSKLQQWVFEEALYAAGAPWLIPFGITYVGPVIYTFGSARQCATWLPPILESDAWWCQGFSEPNAGSDLASLTTRAIRDGNHYLLSGQKTWTTMAQWADLIFVLARTASTPRPQEGISFFLVDLQSRGITVRPIASIDRCAHLNEVFFDEVRVPAAQRVGAEGAGWSYARFLLAQERLLAADVARSRRQLRQLQRLAGQAGAQPALAEQLPWRVQLAEVEVQLLALEALCLEFLQGDAGAGAGPEVSLLKILGSELAQKIAGLTLDVVGRHGLAYELEALQPGVVETGLPGATGAIREYLHGRATTIYGGSNEIQRNIIARNVLGL